MSVMAIFHQLSIPAEKEGLPEHAEAARLLMVLTPKFCYGAGLLSDRVQAAAGSATISPPPFWNTVF